MTVLYVVLGIIGLLLLIAIVKAILFVPKKEQNIAIEEVKVDVVASGATWPRSRR